MPTSTPWHLYILLCHDGTYYTGITNNLEQRICDHNHGRGCRYTKYRWPMRLVYSETFSDKSSALKREAQIQGWSRRKKESLIKNYVLALRQKKIPDSLPYRIGFSV